jgi:hypothetical protein
MSIVRLPEHAAQRPLKRPRGGRRDSQPSTTTVRCALCRRRIYLNMFGKWVHVQDLRPNRFREAKWHLVTRQGAAKHFDLGGGKTACGIHEHSTVKPVDTTTEFGEFQGGWRRCKKCARKVD